MVVIDGNEAAARIAYPLSEVVAIYPITPSSPMAEQAEMWANARVPNLWGSVPVVQQMQSEGGAAGVLHGALQAGALCTTFTASQGLLLMIPNMYKIAGELTPTVFHIAARSIATSSLSIFGDHSDVMAARATGWGMLFSNSVQEAHDLALIAHSATLASRVPFLHIFDGFRTSHEVAKISLVPEAVIRELVDQTAVSSFRGRALNPDHPVIRGTAQNPDVHFQAREAVNPYYQVVPSLVEEAMNRFGELTGREYGLFDYVGHPEAERVIVLMGSGAETAEETVNLLVSRGEKVGLLKVRLFRPFSAHHFASALPPSTRAIAVLDRCKEPGSAGEPLYQDVVTALSEQLTDHTAPFENMPRVIGGRFGLSSKEFTPGMVWAIYTELGCHKPKNHFTVGIEDDVTFSSLPVDPGFAIEQPEVRQAMMYGLGSDGTVSANKNTIKIIGENTSMYAQGYFEYDSKKSGSTTISHLRFGPHPIQSAYLVRDADFVGVHWFPLVARVNVLEHAKKGATLLVNSPYTAAELWRHFPRPTQKAILEKEIKVYAIDAEKISRDAGLKGRINTVMQVAFFSLSGVLPEEEALPLIKKAIRKTYGKAGANVVQANERAVDITLEYLSQVTIPKSATSHQEYRLAVPADAPEFVRDVTRTIIQGEGDSLPVSMIPADGTYPSGTSQYEKRGIATEVPLWDPELCIQCGKCVLVCPHAVIRAKLAHPEEIEVGPESILSAPGKWRGAESLRYLIQVSYEDCTGCTLCRDVCPAIDKEKPSHRALDMRPVTEVSETERQEWPFFLTLPDRPDLPTPLKYNSVKNIQLLRPLFEFSGACAGCGETPYLKLISQLFGDHTLVANATGCSSIFGGNLPTTPWAKNAQGRGPAWSNSLFEDNAEFGLGMRLAVNAQRERAGRLLKDMALKLDRETVDAFLGDNPAKDVEAQRGIVEELKRKLADSNDPQARALLEVADSLVDRSVWIVGGDGWAYDIGFGGLDHVLHSGENVNVLVLDTEVYSNTGGQASKSTARGAIATFATGGKSRPKKVLGRIAMGYGNVYVAQVAMGASDAQTVKAFLEAEAYPGPSLIIAYSQCIAHGIDMAKGLQQQSLAVETGYWPIYRFDPRLPLEGKSPLTLDCKPPTRPIEDYLYKEDRYERLLRQSPEHAHAMLELIRADVKERWQILEDAAKTVHPTNPAQ